MRVSTFMRPIAVLRYLAYPFDWSVLIAIAVLAFFIVSTAFSGLFGLPGLIIGVSWLFKYAFVLLDATIDGRPEPPVLSSEMVNPFEQRPFAFLLVLVGLYAAIGSLETWIGSTLIGSTLIGSTLIGPTLLGALRVTVLCLVPAMIATISITGRTLQSLNPVAVIGTVLRAPLTYLSLLAILGSVWFLTSWALRSDHYSLSELWKKESFLPLSIATQIGLKDVGFGYLRVVVAMYMCLATFASIGGMIFEERHALGVDSAAAPERIAARAGKLIELERDKIMDRIFAAVRGGAFAGASETIRRQVESSTTPLDECRWIYERAQSFPDPRLAKFMADLFLTALLKSGATGEALTLVKNQMRADETYSPQSSGQVLQLARLAVIAGDRGLARQLLVDFDRRFPNDSLRPVAVSMREDLVR